VAIISEKFLIESLKRAKKVLLLEPPYIRHYIPLGLAKISSFVKSNGGQVVYSRGFASGDFDLICISTVFTTDSEIVLKAIKKCKMSLFLGGTHKEILKKCRERFALYLIIIFYVLLKNMLKMLLKLLIRMGRKSYSIMGWTVD